MRQKKCYHRLLGLLLTFVMLFSITPTGYAADTEDGKGHIHTETCYAQAGDLLCTTEEGDGHTHGADCYCKGGEYTCGQEETEGHTHTDACYEISEDSTEKNLICGQEESEGHLHSEDCVCPGGELICGQKETAAHTHGEDCYAKGGELICSGEDAADTALYDAENDAVEVKTAEELLNAVQNAEDGDVITLGKNISYPTTDSDFGPMTVEKKITLDFGGFTLSSVGGVYQSGNDCIFNVASTGSLTLIDAQISTSQYQYSSSTGKGDFIGENNGTVTVESTKGFHIQAGNFIYENYGDVVVKDGWFQLSSYFIGDSYGTVKIFSGNFKNEGCCFDAIYDTVEVFSGHFETESYCFDDVYGNLIIHDATVISESDGIYLSYDNGQYGTATIYAGNFETKSDSIHNPKGCTVTIYTGTFTEIDDTNGCFDGDGTWIIPDGYAADPADWQETQASSIRFYEVKYKVRFYAEEKLIDEQEKPRKDLVFPNDPVNSQGYEFLYWEDKNGKVVDDLSKLTEDTDLYAVFSDRTYEVTFDDKGVQTTITVAANTPLGEIEGIDRKENNDAFRCWLLDGTTVDETTTTPVRSNITLVAAYKTVIRTYDDLLSALAAKKDYIVLTENIPVQDTVVVDYDCTLTSDEKVGLIRPDDFTKLLLTTKASEETSAKEITVTLNNILVDGRNVEAEAPAIAVDENTTLVVENSTIQNNKNTADSWSVEKNGGGIHNNGVLKMYDGTQIINNYAYKGGGVYNNEPENEFPVVFYMYGGEISGNTAFDSSNSCNSAGGGVNVDGRFSATAKFYMYGGKITGNRASEGCGGGVSLCCGDQSIVNTGSRKANIVFTMYNGEITDNTAALEGGGVWVACSTFEMQGGLISRNASVESGGGIAACCGCELNVNITGGAITLNHSENGGGVGERVGGFIRPGVIYDNLASGAGDDIVYTYNDWVEIVNQMPYRKYGSGYVSTNILSESMKNLIAAAKPTVSVMLLNNCPEPKDVMIPFFGWYVDGTTDYWTEKERYTDISSERYSRDGDTLKWTTEDNGNAAKAIWYGVLLAYDANYEGNNDFLYDEKAYIPGEKATVKDGMFTRDGYKFIGWNTKADGSGDTTYTKDMTLDMTGSRILYAQWEKLPDTGSLSVSKVVAGNAGSTTKEFSFTVKLDDSSINGTYGDMTFENGVAAFTLKHNEKKTASDIPEGVAYEVTEEDANKNGYTTVSSRASGTILKDKTVEAAFTNTKNSSDSNGGGSGKKYGTLTVSKTVTGNAGDTTKAFSFTVKLDSSLSGTYGDMTFENGVAEFTLKHGESKTATKLPAGTHYTVTESENEGYSVTAEGDTGDIVKNKAAVAVFVNHKDGKTETPDTPDTPNLDNPNIPTDPNQPNVPNNPEQPNVPNTPVNPEEPKQTNPSEPTNHYDSTPKTGDAMNPTLWFSLMGVSLAGILFCIFKKALKDKK